MSDSLRDLLSFEPTDLDSWRKDVERALKGRAFDDVLIKRGIDGLPLNPLYTRGDLPPNSTDEVPGTASFVRGFPASDADSAPRRGWLRATEIEHPDIAQANRELLADLEGGIERAVVRIASARERLAPPQALHSAASGRGGVWIDDVNDLSALLDRVAWPLAPVSLLVSARAAFTEQVFAFCDRLTTRDGDGLGVQIDVIAVDGQLQTFADGVAGEIRRASAGTLHRADARVLRISTTSLREAGADMVQEVAAAIGVFAAVARQFDGTLTPDALLRVTEFHFGTGADFFGEIAKLRAFRRCLALMLDAYGITDHANAVFISASTAEETLARRDVYVNLLRTTAEATAAALGGSDAVVIRAFDARFNGGSALGHRLARNLHSLLAEESNIDAVIDPAGGSFYIESRTEQLAEAAWQQFTVSERGGGFFSSRDSAEKEIAERRQARTKRLRSRRDAVLGVSVFPNLNEQPLRSGAFNAHAFIEHWHTRLGDAANVDDESANESDVHYLDDDFEMLRARTDAITAATGSRPEVFGALLGSLSDHAPRLDWVRDLLGSAGIVLNAQALDADATPIDAKGAATAIVIAADALHGSTVPGAVARIRAAGIEHIVIAGRPGEHESALREAGANAFVYAGMDVIPWLTQIIARVEAAHAAS